MFCDTAVVSASPPKFHSKCCVPNQAMNGISTPHTAPIKLNSTVRGLSLGSATASIASPWNVAPAVGATMPATDSEAETAGDSRLMMGTVTLPFGNDGGEQ